MTPEAQRIAIAEACGWVERVLGTWGKPNYPPDHLGVKDQVWHDESDLPDYLSDLNAMHEAEEVLSTHPMDGEYANYCNWLTSLCGDECKAIRATAAQRAEAFLRCINRWEEA